MHHPPRKWYDCFNCVVLFCLTMPFWSEMHANSACFKYIVALYKSYGFPGYIEAVSIVVCSIANHSDSFSSVVFLRSSLAVHQGREVTALVG